MAPVVLTDFTMDTVVERAESNAFTACFVGRRGTGKSWAVRELLHALHKDRGVGAIFSPTEDSSSFYEAFTPSLFIHSEVDLDLVQRLVRAQKSRAERGDRTRQITLVFDDCMFDPRFLKSTIIRSLFMNGRHLCINVILCTQYVVDMPTFIRTQLDFVFLMKESSPSVIHKLWQNFGSILNQKQFADVLSTATERIGSSLAINNVNGTLGMFVSSELSDFRIFNPKFWAYAAKHTSANEKETVRAANGTVVRKKGRSS